MLTHEERRILGYLGSHGSSRAAELGRACLPDTPRTWFERILFDLEWRGYLIVYYDPAGRPLAVQPTKQGRAAVHAAARSAEVPQPPR